MSYSAMAWSARRLETITVDGSNSVLDVNGSVFLGNVTGNNGTALSTLTIRNGARLLVGDRAFGPSLLGETEGTPPAQVDISDDLTSIGGEILIRPGSLLSADNDIAITSEFSSYGRGDPLPARRTRGPLPRRRPRRLDAARQRDSA
jgi:hypothetical protein